MVPSELLMAASRSNSTIRSRASCMSGFPNVTFFPTGWYPLPTSLSCRTQAFILISSGSEKNLLAISCALLHSAVSAPWFLT
eukprot:CAMPEP_0173408692 /NCGR_PEP_ID=MMETSP1356-20130122/70384_1 /TAXON_ID=77927 ORGANISM="Hemiselmis virescens, Strain PCC157" /NCGR_SAMPLE_ID=MMETSP1356 /ASSEMBLY_ACC=CAM_ASM_000847 /LENGTH=81 /DNA_ID=CAMNT_0014370037 /DNA_START=142 /DNA_END=387 /DNA_ORIENTATION=-